MSENRVKIFYDLSEPISKDDPPKIKRLKKSYQVECTGDSFLQLGVLIFVLGLLIYVFCQIE